MISAEEQSADDLPGALIGIGGDEPICFADNATSDLIPDLDSETGADDLIVEEIAEEYGGKLKVAKMDIDSNMQTPQQYSIRGIPTLMIFRDGKVQATKVGALTKGQLKAFVDEVV